MLFENSKQKLSSNQTIQIMKIIFDFVSLFLEHIFRYLSKEIIYGFGTRSKLVFIIGYYYDILSL